MYYIFGNKKHINQQQLEISKKHYKKITQKIKKIQRLYKQLDKQKMRLNNRSINNPLQKALDIYSNALENIKVII